MGIAELRSQVGAKLRHRVPATLAARQLFVGCLLVFVGCCYWGILDTFFVQDDFFILSAVRRAMPNMHMLRGTYFFRPLSTYWIPLLNATLWGFAPIPHHATYLALFLATVGAAVRLVVRLHPFPRGVLGGNGRVRLFEDARSHVGLDCRRHRRIGRVLFRPQPLGRQPVSARRIAWPVAAHQSCLGLPA